MKKLFMIFTLVVCSSAFAGTAEKYATLTEIQGQQNYSLTCSDVSQLPQLHVAIDVSLGKLYSINILGITPAEAITTIFLSEEKVAALTYSLTVDELSITGSIPEYFNEDVSLVLHNSAAGMTGAISYDDNDGMSFSRTVKCGAINYVDGI